MNADQRMRARAAQDKYRATHRKERWARERARATWRRGHIEQASVCECCGSSTTLRAHHYDYDRPLLFVWLCHTCHYKEHSSAPNGLAPTDHALLREYVLCMRSRAGVQHKLAPWLVARALDPAFRAAAGIIEK